MLYELNSVEKKSWVSKDHRVRFIDISKHLCHCIYFVGAAHDINVQDNVEDNENDDENLDFESEDGGDHSKTNETVGFLSPIYIPHSKIIYSPSLPVCLLYHLY